MFSEKRGNVLHGVLLIALFSCSAFYIAEFQFVKQMSFSPLIVGIILGMLYANSLRNHLPETWVPGILFCTKQVLRAYYPALCRFMTMDPLCEKYYSISPYAYCNNNPVNYVDPDGRDWYEYTDKDGNSQTMWRKSQDKIYKDDNGNTWNNIGQNYLSINGDNATLFTQHTNSKGELYLSSSSYNLADEKNANALNSTLGNLLSKEIGRASCRERV